MTDQTQTAPAPSIQLLEPKGYRRASIVFMNGRLLIFDAQVEDLVELVRAFNADESRDFLELPVIEQQDETLCFAFKFYFSREAISKVQTIAPAYIKAVPGRPTQKQIAVVRASDRAVADLQGLRR